jgi:hypothetical protein
MLHQKLPLSAQRADGSASPTAKANGQATWLLALLGTVIIGLFANSAPDFASHATSSDALLPISFAWNLLHQSGTIGGFQLPRIPSIFPDLVMLVSFDDLMGENWRWTMLAYSLVQATAMTLMASAVIARLARASLSDAALAFVTVLAVVVVVSDLAVLDLSALYLPVEHFSTFLLSLFCLWLILRYLDDGRISTLSSLCLTIGMAELSSQKFLVDFTIPAMVATAALACLRLLPFLRSLAIGGASLIGMVVGRLADHLLLRQTDVALTEIGSHVRKYLVEVPTYLLERPVITLVCLVIPQLIALIAAASWLGHRYDGRWFKLPAADIPIAYIGSVGMLAWWGAEAALVIVYVDVGSFRYLAPALFWPLIISAAVLVHLARPYLRTLSLIQLGAIAALLCVRFGPAGFVPPLLDWKHPLATCLERAQLRQGLADYWNSRSATASSGWTIQIDQITSDAQVYFWGNNKQWYDHSFADPTRAPDYNFIVTTRLDVDKLRARFGEPQSHLRCGDDDVWIYPDGRRLHDLLVKP